VGTRMIDGVDLDRYPINDLEGEAGRALVERCRADLARQGACDLPGFLTADAVQRIVADIPSWNAEPYRTETSHNIDFSGREEELAEDDPLRIQVRSAKSLIAYDQIPESSPLRAVYEADELTAFVGAALGVDPIYRQADEIGALNVMTYDPGDELGWHFDNADFVVTLMLQAPDAGGAFEYVPMLRSPGEDNAQGVAALLGGDRAGVRTMSPEPGTLALFRGHFSPHRVTPVEGPTQRINAVLSYADRPDARLSASGRRIFFGRED
jgi:hypothetical protein